MKNIFIKALAVVIIFICALMLFCACESEKENDRPVMNINIETRSDGTSYTVYDGSRQYCYQIEEGEGGDFRMEIVVGEGSIDAVIYEINDKDNPIYRGTDMPTSEFTVHSDKPGDYRILFTAHEFVGDFNCNFSKTTSENH